jgi:DNA-binding HxlR family transcriptional regulator
MTDDFRDVLCPKWSLDILRLLVEDSPQNYSRIEAELDTSSDVVVERLQLLADAGLLERNERSTKDVRYSISTRGEELLTLLEEIDALLYEE